MSTASISAAAWSGVESPAGVLAVLLVVLAGVFFAAKHPQTAPLFKVVPALVFCYFVPTLLTTCGVIPDRSPLYSWVKTYVLPACLLLLVLSLDVPGLLRLGWKALAMMLVGTAGVVIGGPIAVLVCGPLLPEGAAVNLAPLAGSWIGGAANMTAIKESLGVTDAQLSPVVITDVLIANVWMGLLLLAATKQEAIDRRTGADARAIRELEERMTRFQEQTRRMASTGDLLTILALGFAGSWISVEAGTRVGAFLENSQVPHLGEIFPPEAWKYILVTTIGVVLSFTKVRNLEGAGASQIGTVLLYLLIACIGAGADFRAMRGNGSYVLAGAVWMFVHAAGIILVARLLRAPVFFAAVGSQANIGGAASAPIVASAFHPALAPVGVLLAVLGYVLGTYMGLVCGRLMQWAG